MKKGLCVGLVLASAALVACEKSSTHEEKPTALEAAKTTTHWYLTEATTLRVEPVAEERIAHPQEARDTSNWKGVLFRGDRVTVLRDSGNWVEIQKESGATGWVESAYLLAGDEVMQATIVENVESFIKRASAQPEEKKLDKENNPPIFKVKFFNDQKNLDNISCYSNEGDRWEKSKIKLENKLLTIEFRGAFFPRRGRINCSLNDDGKWRWFGTQFTIKLN